jgi:hypothetical protein
VVVQRAACHGTLCAGIGSVESFYKGYYAAAFAAFGQPHIPVFIRWRWSDRYVEPYYFSALSSDLHGDQEREAGGGKAPAILLKNQMCFERVVRRADTDYGNTPTVSASAVQQFKKTAFAMVGRLEGAGPIPTHFSPGPPYRLLLSYRGPLASRHIANLQEFASELRAQFPAPLFELQLMNNSDPQLSFQAQLRAVAEAHIVITNHGAFEGNMIYMRNGSLLIEVFGHYGNNEIHVFHRLALMFGVYYARVHPPSLTDHQAFDYNLSTADMKNIVDTAKEYFSLKPFMHNLAP